MFFSTVLVPTRISTGSWSRHQNLTDSSTPNSQVIEAFLLCMFLFCTFYPTLPSGPPCSEQQGAPAPSSSQDPVSLRSRSRNDSNTVSVLVSLMHLLQVHYRFFIRGARVTRITGRSRPPGGVGLTPRQYTAWNVWGRARATGGLSLSRGCCLQCAVLLVLGGVLPNLELELSHKEPKQQTQTLGPVPGWYI